MVPSDNISEFFTEELQESLKAFYSKISQQKNNIVKKYVLRNFYIFCKTKINVVNLL